MKRVLLVAAIAAMVLAPLLWLPHSREQVGGIIEPFGTIMEDVTVVSRQDGQVLWTLKTAIANIPEGGSEAHMTDVTVNMSGEGVTVKAADGLYGLSDGSLRLGGGVRAEGSRYVIATDSAEVDAASGAITSKDQVVLEGNGYRVVGYGLKALEGKVWLLDNVQAEFY